MEAIKMFNIFKKKKVLSLDQFKTKVTKQLTPIHLEYKCKGYEKHLLRCS